jgi:hypothetical protein
VQNDQVSPSDPNDNVDDIYLRPNPPTVTMMRNGPSTQKPCGKKHEVSTQGANLQVAVRPQSPLVFVNSCSLIASMIYASWYASLICIIGMHLIQLGFSGFSIAPDAAM